MKNARDAHREITGWRPGEVFRLCLDLNVWVAASISSASGRSGTASQVLTQAARAGECALGPTQLIVSWGMLNRLRVVLTRIGMPPEEVDAVVANIATTAQLGPAGMNPLLVLGGTGMAAMRDEEDLHVLDAAVAGRAHVIATYDWDDFHSYRSDVLLPDRIARHRTADHELLIAHPAEAVRWVRTGVVTLN